MTNSSDTAETASPSRLHDLKTWPDAFERMRTGAKKAEFRKDDRGFKVGDTLELREWDPETSEYTGKTLVRIVTDIAVSNGGRFGIPEGYVMMSFRSPTAQDLEEIQCADSPSS